MAPRRVARTHLRAALAFALALAAAAPAPPAPRACDASVAISPDDESIRLPLTTTPAKNASSPPSPPPPDASCVANASATYVVVALPTRGALLDARTLAPVRDAPYVVAPGVAELAFRPAPGDVEDRLREENDADDDADPSATPSPVFYDSLAFVAVAVPHPRDPSDARANAAFAAAAEAEATRLAAAAFDAFDAAPTPAQNAVAILEVTVLPSSVASPPSSRPPTLRAFDALAETWEDTPTRVLVRGDARRDVLDAKLLEGASVAMLLDEAPRRGDVYSLIVGPVPETAASRDEPPQGVGGSFAAETRPELFGSSAPFGSSATRLRAGDLVPARRGAACDEDEPSADSSAEAGDREDDASSEGLLQQGVPAAGGSGSGSGSGSGFGFGSGGAGAERVRLCAEVGYAPAADAHDVDDFGRDVGEPDRFAFRFAFVAGDAHFESPEGRLGEEEDGEGEDGDGDGDGDGALVRPDDASGGSTGGVATVRVRATFDLPAIRFVDDEDANDDSNASPDPNASSDANASSHSGPLSSSSYSDSVVSAPFLARVALPRLRLYTASASYPDATRAVRVRIESASGNLVSVSAAPAEALAGCAFPFEEGDGTGDPAVAFVAPVPVAAAILGAPGAVEYVNVKDLRGAGGGTGGGGASGSSPDPASPESSSDVVTVTVSEAPGRCRRVEPPDGPTACEPFPEGAGGGGEGILRRDGDGDDEGDDDGDGDGDGNGDASSSSSSSSAPAAASVARVDVRLLPRAAAGSSSGRSSRDDAWSAALGGGEAGSRVRAERRVLRSFPIAVAAACSAACAVAAAAARLGRCVGSGAAERMDALRKRARAARARRRERATSLAREQRRATRL